jgi:Tfp pilus assembly protein PilX
MINSYLKIDKKERGAITLMMSVVLLTAVTLIVLFAASYAIMQQKISSNQSHYSSALNAAEAGVDFGIQYLLQNSTTILANPVSGFISPYSDVNTTNITLANNSKFTVVYTNPIANNYTLLQITSTGTNADSTSTRVVRQQVQLGSLLSSTPNYGLTGKNSITLSGNAIITNTSTNNTVQSGSTVSISGSASTVTSGGGSNAGNIGSDIQQNNTTIQNQSIEDFFATYFGISSTTVKNTAQHYYSNNSDTNYSSQLNGLTGTTIWIDQTGGTASLTSNATIGSPTNPVLLIVNGPLSISGNVTFYGLIFVSSTTGVTTATGNPSIFGAMITGDALTVSGSSSFSYDPTVLTNLRNSNATRYYARVPGSWRDF